MLCWIFYLFSFYLCLSDLSVYLSDLSVYLSDLSVCPVCLSYLPACLSDLCLYFLPVCLSYLSVYLYDLCVCMSYLSICLTCLSDLYVCLSELSVCLNYLSVLPVPVCLTWLSVLPVCLTVRLSDLSVLSVCLTVLTYLSICLTCLSVWPFCLSVCLSVWLTCLTCLSVHLSVRLSDLSVYLSDLSDLPVLPVCLLVCLACSFYITIIHNNRSISIAVLVREFHVSVDRRIPWSQRFSSCVHDEYEHKMVLVQISTVFLARCNDEGEDSLACIIIEGETWLHARPRARGVLENGDTPLLKSRRSSSLNHPLVRPFSRFSGIWTDQSWSNVMKRVRLWCRPLQRAMLEKELYGAVTEDFSLNVFFSFMDDPCPHTWPLQL